MVKLHGGQDRRRQTEQAKAVDDALLVRTPQTEKRANVNTHTNAEKKSDSLCAQAPRTFNSENTPK